MTFDNILDNILGLPDEQQESLVNIIKSRLNEKYRDRIARDAKTSIEEFKNNLYKPEPASVLVHRLHTLVENDEK